MIGHFFLVNGHYRACILKRYHLCEMELFITQKKCLRIMFGDNEAYHNKFKTAARVRPRELQKLGAEFYEL